MPGSLALSGSFEQGFERRLQCSQFLSRLDCEQMVGPRPRPSEPEFFSALNSDQAHQSGSCSQRPSGCFVAPPCHSCSIQLLGQLAPRPESKAGMVLIMICKSSHND